MHPNSLRYAAATGTVVIRWEGSRQPTIWTVPPPETDPRDARLELARRYLHIYGACHARSLWPVGGDRPAASARLLPSGDAYLLLQGADRDLLVPDADRRRALWTPRVWPGGLLLGGEIAGIWRRAGTALTVQPWRPLSRAQNAMR